MKDLKKEIKLLEKLKHENIVAFYFYEETVQALSIFMEYVPGVCSISELSENLVFLNPHELSKMFVFHS